VTVINSNAVLTDLSGMEWRIAPSFQDLEVNAPGWLMLRSANGQELSYPEVVNRYGFTGEGGKRYLVGRYVFAPHETCIDLAEFRAAMSPTEWMCGPDCPTEVQP
jgi:hypothetical protein